MKLDQFIKTAKSIYKINAANKDLWRQEMYEKRWKNFFTVWVYIAVCMFFIWLGIVMREGFFNIIYWYIWEGLAWTFLVLGIYTMLSYLAIIIKGKK